MIFFGMLADSKVIEDVRLSKIKISNSLNGGLTLHFKRELTDDLPAS